MQGVTEIETESMSIGGKWPLMRDWEVPEFDVQAVSSFSVFIATFGGKLRLALARVAGASSR